MAADILQAATYYGWVGLAVAAVFLLWGVDRIDPSARGAYLFRALALPGVVVLWPLVLLIWAARARAASRPTEGAS